MIRKKLIYERTPIGDYLPDEFKQMAKQSATTSDQGEKMQKQRDMMQSMMQLPSVEAKNKSKLEELAIKALFELYPKLEEVVESGLVIIDAKLGGSKGRVTSQKGDPEKEKSAREKNKNFDALQKKRHYQNALTQGKSWIEGFNFITNNMDEELDEIDPTLYGMYRNFTKGISDYYWDNIGMLERMADSATGRMAYVDVTRTSDGKIKIEARAPFLPLLLHELVKGAEYYKSAFSLPKDKELRQALLKTTDTHKHEIQNMNYGRAIVNKMRQILSSEVNGYTPKMEIIISSKMDMLPEDQFNEMMDGIVSDNRNAILKFIVFAEKAIKNQ